MLIQHQKNHWKLYFQDRETSISIAEVATGKTILEPETGDKLITQFDVGKIKLRCFNGKYDQVQVRILS